jgi:hypothetical protein
MHDERDDYDAFLDTWEPSRQLHHAVLDAYVGDPLMRERLLKGDDDPDAITRVARSDGYKAMEADEQLARLADYFPEVQPGWSADFRDLALANGVPGHKFDLIAEAFRQDWVDGYARRHKTPVMMGLKASIRDHDRFYHGSRADGFVLNHVPETVKALLTPGETRAWFEANSNLLHLRIPDYLDEFGDLNFAGLNHLYVRRGVHMPLPEDGLRRELHYLSSYSLSLGPVEQFARTLASASRETDVPIIFSAPLPALQTRTIAFAPFISGMDLRQLELVVAPPVEAVPLMSRGEYGGIHEYEFE